MTEPMTDARLDALLAQHMAVVTQLGAINEMPLSARWRLIQGDSENLDCIGPVCPHEDQHNRVYDGTPDTCGQYDCCPYPVIECHTELIAAWIVELLNTTPALVAEVRRLRAENGRLDTLADNLSNELAESGECIASLRAQLAAKEA